MEEQVKRQADEIYASKVRRARLADPAKKMGWGAELYMESIQRMKAGIRARFPDLTEEAVMEKLRWQLDRLRQVQEQGIYRKVDRVE